VFSKPVTPIPIARPELRREVVFPTEVTILPASKGKPTVTEVIISSLTLTSKLGMSESNEEIDPLDKES